MARTQAKIITTIWSDPDWTGLTGNAQRVYLLLLSQPKLTIAGCLDVMPARWANLAADDTPEAIATALDELARARYIVVDGDELIIRTFVAHDLGTGAVNSNLVKGLWSAWAAIMSPLLRKVIVDEMPDKVFGRDGIDVPDQAKQLRSEPRLELPLEPRFEPGLEPQSEPSVDLQSVDLLTADCSPTKSQDYSQPDPQTLAKAAALVARQIASTDATTNPAGLAAAIATRINNLDVPDDDRDRIVAALAAGQTPEEIAAGWDAAKPDWLTYGGSARTEPAAPPRPPLRPFSLAAHEAEAEAQRAILEAQAAAS